jgi:hypothetical protein
LVYPKILSEVENVDFVFLDGKEDPEQTIKEYNMFLPHMKSPQRVTEVLLTPPLM